MKTLLFAFAALSVGGAIAQTPQASPPSVTEEELAARFRNAEIRDLEKKSRSDEMSDPARESRPANLIERSTVICYNGGATLVPKGAVLHLPESLNDRIGLREGAKFSTWADFQAANRGWLVTQEVTLDQALGKDPLPEAVTKRLSKEINVVVATYQGGPISMLKGSETSAKEATR